MKCTYIILIVLFGASVASAQDKSDKECRLKQRVSDSLIQLAQYDKAFDAWLEVRKKCPSLNEKVYTTGAELLKIKADRSKADEKEANAKELLRLYDDYNRYFPSNTAPIALYKAVIMHKYKIGTDAEVYALLDRSFAKNLSDFKDMEALSIYLGLYYDKYKAGDNTVTVNQVLKKRDDIIAHIESLTAESPANANHNNRAIEAIRRVVLPISTCENLDVYYGEVFEKKKTDTIWISSTMKSLLENNCRSSKLYAQLSEAQQSIKPTAQSTYDLGVMAYQKANFKDAETYFIQSSELAKDPQQKADTYFTLASTIYYGRDKAKVKEYANKALQINPNYYKSYVLLSQLYAEAGSDCGQTPFEKKALNWLAAETLKKAIAANRNMGSLEKQVRKYEEKAPTATEIKEAKMEAKTITFGCWINESISVPKK